MNIKLWWCESMGQWRWTLVKNDRPICKQESGQRPNLQDAMIDIANTVNYLINQEDKQKCQKLTEISTGWGSRNPLLYNINNNAVN